jgi:hypothetical protein
MNHWKPIQEVVVPFPSEPNDVVSDPEPDIEQAPSTPDDVGSVSKDDNQEVDGSFDNDQVIDIIERVVEDGSDDVESEAGTEAEQPSTTLESADVEDIDAGGDGDIDLADGDSEGGIGDFLSSFFD